MKHQTTQAGLEVVAEQPALEVAEAGLEPYVQHNSTGPLENSNANSHANIAVLGLSERQPKSRGICGLPPPTFFLAVAVILVIMLAGIGGGVGGTLAVSNAKKKRLSQVMDKL